ncbi:hypothetical protein PQQ51_10690, partial [Paraburkholderia xenovorans]|uniref:hypothetical protein n=1 Tax=Paraburkholderia xenovorans TaxID=36873 RepID=UPI0038B8D078
KKAGFLRFKAPLTRHETRRLTKAGFCVPASRCAENASLKKRRKNRRFPYQFPFDDYPDVLLSRGDG